MAKSGLRPIVDIYSTFLQRSYDQIFQEVALQNLPVTFCLDRAGLCGPDGPTHHGVFDNTYMRVFPNMVLTAPGDGQELGPMLDFALGLDSARRRSAIRRPTRRRSSGPSRRIELGRAEVIDWGTDGTFVAYGALLGRCVEAARRLRQEGLDVGRDQRPLRQAARHRNDPAGRRPDGLRADGGREAPSAAASARPCWKRPRAAGVGAGNIRCLGIPDRFIEHGERDELLADLGLDVRGFVAAARALAGGATVVND